MKLLPAIGPRGLISLLLVALAAQFLARGGRLHQMLCAPLNRVLRLHSPAERSLKAEVETRFQHFLVPDEYVEFPKRFITLPKRDVLSRGLESAASRLKRVGSQHGVGEVKRQQQQQVVKGNKALAFLEWTSQRKFHLHRPKRRLGVLRIKPLPPEATPLIAIVNSKSGGRQGKGLFKKLKAALCKGQVFDISKVSLQEALRLYSNLTNPMTILCCGGDGTVSRVLEAVNDMQWASGQAPRVAVLPLGTGNDLAKSLDWGEHVMDWSGGYFAREASDGAILSVLEDVRRGLDRKMDRWEVTVTPGTAVPSIENNKPPLKSMVAYLGIGVDGKVALDFHRLREKCPWLFVSPAVNKAIYAIMGLTDFFVRSCKNLPDKVELWCDGKQVPLPPLTESFIIFNINSHAGGVQLWPEGDDDNDAPPLPAGGGPPGGDGEKKEEGGNEASSSSPTFYSSRWDDGLLEVVAASGVLHLGKIRVGWARPIRLAQAREIRIRTKSFLPGQIDGEPWKLPRCELTIRAAGQNNVVQFMSADIVRFADWLEKKGQLGRGQREALLKAFKSKGSLNVNTIPRK